MHTHAEADPGWASTHRLLPVCARSRDSGTRVCTPAHARAGTWGARWRAHTRASAAAFLSNHACTLCAYLYTRMNTQVRPHAHMCMHTQRHTHVHSHSFLQPLLGATTSVYTDRCVCAYGVHRGTPLQVHARSRMTQAGLILGAAPFLARSSRFLGRSAHSAAPRPHVSVTLGNIRFSLLTHLPCAGGGRRRLAGCC